MEEEEDLCALWEDFQQMCIRWREMIAADKAMREQLATLQELTSRQDKELIQLRQETEEKGKIIQGVEELPRRELNELRILNIQQERTIQKLGTQVQKLKEQLSSLRRSMTIEVTRAKLETENIIRKEYAEKIAGARAEADLKCQLMLFHQKKENLHLKNQLKALELAQAEQVANTAVAHQDLHIYRKQIREEQLKIYVERETEVKDSEDSLSFLPAKKSVKFQDPVAIKTEPAELEEEPEVDICWPPAKRPRMGNVVRPTGTQLPRRRLSPTSLWRRSLTNQRADNHEGPGLDPCAGAYYSTVKAKHRADLHSFSPETPGPGRSKGDNYHHSWSSEPICDNPEEEEDTTASSIAGVQITCSPQQLAGQPAGGKRQWMHGSSAQRQQLRPTAPASSTHRPLTSCLKKRSTPQKVGPSPVKESPAGHSKGGLKQLHISGYCIPRPGTSWGKQQTSVRPSMSSGVSRVADAKLPNSGSSASNPFPMFGFMKPLPQKGAVQAQQGAAHSNLIQQLQAMIDSTAAECYSTAQRLPASPAVKQQQMMPQHQPTAANSPITEHLPPAAIETSTKGPLIETALNDTDMPNKFAASNITLINEASQAPPQPMPKMPYLPPTVSSSVTERSMTTPISSGPPRLYSTSFSPRVSSHHLTHGSNSSSRMISSSSSPHQQGPIYTSVKFPQPTVKKSAKPSSAVKTTTSMAMPPTAPLTPLPPQTLEENSEDNGTEGIKFSGKRRLFSNAVGPQIF